ncbi:MAG: M14 family metallopeptidase [Flavobacteriales bacterium]|nr:M14 family metallopeptidase [Flavobacteriales bacterium]
MLVNSQAQFVLPGDNQTPTWDECISFYRELDKQSTQAGLLEIGTTDIGKPLHLFVINQDGIFYPELFDRNKVILMINNGIHPGEPDGVNASMMLAQQLLDGSPASTEMLKHVIVCMIPIYNVDGALNRGSYSRANQNGPKEYGFRGNAKNLDLNRDFVKCDSKNAQTFNQIFSRIKPHVLVDTHVSNGADYPYTMTLITTQTDKLGGSLGRYVKSQFEPALFSAMEKEGDKMCPYVNTMGRTPETGIVDFFESPRFATGYAALFNTIGFTTETHMLKPFNQRVKSTSLFLKILLDYVQKHDAEIRLQVAKAEEEMLAMKRFPIGFELDTTKLDSLIFSGYEARNESSSIGSGDRLKYDHQSPWTRKINWYRKFKVVQEVEMPEYYIIPQGWTDVLERLRWNGVKTEVLSIDSVMSVQAYRIIDYQTGKRPYEGHYLHEDVKTELMNVRHQFFAGDVMVKTNQPACRYICHVLEPQCEDSFFAWNFFDSMLQQKEWFSDYVFEDIAAELLRNDQSLKKQFDAAMKDDETLKANHWNQLYWIYQHSPYFEQTLSLYPIFRMSTKRTY